jgi:hypothetical protein
MADDVFPLLRVHDYFRGISEQSAWLKLLRTMFP